jgi:serine phosphatase RsbU (regulator of sigma subunit)/DNA-binding NarL/FixJ family response regulator
MNERNPIRVIIVDDQAIVRSGLSAFLMAFEELQLVGEAENGEEAIQLCALVQPDVVLMDIKMPRMDGIATTRIIHQRWPQIQVLILTSFRDNEVVQSALDAGATGYLLKDATANELAEAILEVYQGHKTLSQEAKQSLVRAQHLQKLMEEMRDSQPRASTLGDLLAKHVPNIFPESRIQVRLFPSEDLLTYTETALNPIPQEAWDWLLKSKETRGFFSSEALPWGGLQPVNSGLLITPLLSIEDGQPIGGIGILLQGETDDFEEHLHVLRSLAGLISGTIEETRKREENRARSYVTQELVTAGKIQASILPERPPNLPGWSLTAILEPARQTSGDFYDFIPLPNGKWGIVIADVTDKGMGAALIMTLTNTLIRTYASQYPTLPAFALSAVNRRILSDSRGDMFVTAFYGVLEPDMGRLRYSNAGHNPPLLISSQKGKPVDRLVKTGMALGVSEDATWQQKIARLSPGDYLLLYTDGITEAQNARGQFFGEQRLLKVARAKTGCVPREVQKAVLKEVHTFTGDAPKQDDLAIVVLGRNL